MSLSKYEEAMDAYSILMQEAKQRLLFMDKALEGKTGLPKVAIREYCFLQLRMLCELIALGCLTAHGDLVTGKLKKAWKKADQIINDLQGLHPEFYPHSATDNVFTKEELMKLYWKCGDMLHRGTFQTLWSRDRYADAGIEDIRTWRQKIEALLGDHTIFMADGRTAALFRLRDIQVGTDDPGE